MRVIFGGEARVEYIISILFLFVCLFSLFLVPFASASYLDYPSTTLSESTGGAQSLSIISFLENTREQQIISESSYFFPLITRSDIAFGSPVMWNITLTKNPEYADLTEAVQNETTLSFSTPSIEKVDEVLTLDEDWLLLLTLYTDYSKGYDEVSFVQEIPQSFDISTLSYSPNSTVNQLNDTHVQITASHISQLTKLYLSTNKLLFADYLPTDSNESFVIDFPFVTTIAVPPSLPESNVQTRQSSQVVSTDSVGNITFSASKGQFQYIFVDTDLSVVFVVGNISLGEKVDVTLSLPFALDTDVEYYFWKEVNNESFLLPYSLSPDGTELTLHLEDGVFDEDGEVNGIIIDPFEIPIPANNLKSVSADMRDKKGKLSIGKKQLGLETSSGTFKSLKAVNSQNIKSKPKVNANFPYELTKFSIDNLSFGESVTVNLSYPYLDYRYELVKFNPNTQEWYEIPYTRINSTTIQMTLTDGGIGDDDGVVNGVIEDDVAIIIIPIIGANHLSANGSLIANITDEVIELDGVWSEPIYHNERIHAIFEQNLTKLNDVTIFARAILDNSSEMTVDVYEHYTNQYVGTLTVTENESLEKIFLTWLDSPSAEFDLVVVSPQNNSLESIEFDWVTDPTALPVGGDVVLRPQTCAAETRAAKGSFGSACTGTYPAACGATGDRLSCNDGILETFATQSGNKYAGIRISSFNSAITNCEAITSVTVCYEWWTQTSAVTDCDVSLDNDGDGSWVPISTVCPGTTVNPTPTCVNVTNYDGGFVCSNFFGASGTRAQIKSEAIKSTSGGAIDVNWDTLYYDVVYTADTTPPAVTRYEPVDASNTNQTSVDFIYAAIDGKLNSCTLWGNFSGTWAANETNSSMTSGANDTISLTLAQGVYAWNVFCDDTAGNSGFAGANYTFTVDTAAPTVTLNQPSPNLYTNDSTPTLNWTATDVYDASLNCDVYIDGAIVQSAVASSSGSPTTYTPSTLGEGQHNWTVSCIDDAQNRFTPAVQFFTVDTSVPSIVLDIPGDNGVFSSSDTISFNWTMTDTYSPNATCNLYVDAILNKTSISLSGVEDSETIPSFTSGTHPWYVSCIDLAGNTQTSSTRNFIIDTVSPVVDLKTPVTATLTNVSPTVFTYNVTDVNSAIASCSLIVNGTTVASNATPITQFISQTISYTLTEGLNQNWTVSCTDEFSNVGTANPVNIISFDQIPPLISLEEINGTTFNVNENICLNATVSDSLSGVDTVTAYIDYPASGSTPVTLSNAAGCGNAGGNVYAAVVLLDEVGIYNWTNTIAVDSAGNAANDVISPQQNWSATSSFLLTNTMIAPATNIEINESDSVTYNYRQECSATCDLSSSATCEDVVLGTQYFTTFWKPINTSLQELNSSVNSFSCGNLTVGSSCAYNFTVSSSTFSGGNTYDVRCSVVSSNAPSAYSTNVSVQINDHPIVDFSSPLNSTVLSGNVTLTSNATDDQGIATYTFEVDSFSTFASATTICSGASNSCLFDTLAQTQCADNSDCFVRQTVIDNDGLSNSTIFQYEIDNTQPSILLDSPVNATTNGAATTFRYTATDSYLNTCTLYGNFSGSWVANQTNGSIVSGVQDSVELTLPTGTYIWNVECSDDEGNTGFAPTNNTVYIDADAPTVTLTTPMNNQIVNTSSVDFTYIPTDANLDTCELYTNQTSWGSKVTNTTPTSGISNSFTRTFTDGVYLWNVRCTDTLSNTNFNPINYTLTVDTTAPTTFNLISPINATESQDLTPLLDWTDTSDLTFVNYTVELDTVSNFASPDFTYVTTQTQTNSSYQVISNIADDTEYFWRVTAYDNASNSRVSTNTFAYITDNTAPVVQQIAPVDALVFSANSAMQFDLNVSDTNSIQNCSVRLNGVLDVEDTIYSVAKDTTVSIFKTPISNGLYNWSAICYDGAGNSFETANRTLTINVSYPQYQFFATDTTNTQTPSLSLTQDGTVNSFSASCVRNSAVNVITATGTVGANGFLLLGNQVVSYGGNFTVDRQMYATFSSAYEDGFGFQTITTDGDDALGGTSIPASGAYAAQNTLTGGGDTYISPTGSLRYISNMYYTAPGGGPVCDQFYDGSGTYVQLYGYQIGFANATNLNETTIILNETDTTTLTCEYDCTQGYCMDATAQIQLNTTSGWQNVGASGNIILASGQSNNIALGNINTSQNVTFTLEANKASFENVLRCRARSTYDNYSSLIYTTINVSDNDAPIFNIHNATPQTVYYADNITFYANVTDNIAVDTVTIEIDGTNYTMTNSSPDIYEYTINSSLILGGTQNYTMYANDTSGNNALVATDEFTVNTVDVFISNYNFASQIVVGENTTIQVNVSNNGSFVATNVVLNVSIYDFVLGSYVYNQSLIDTITVPAGSSYVVNLSWYPSSGNHKLNATIDESDVVLEVIETNNVFVDYLDVSSWEILYGSIDNYQKVLFDSSDNGFTTWSLATPAGIQYYADVDASWLPFDLVAFNQTNDFNDSDIALGSTYYNDSIQKLFDANNDGVADQTRVVSIAGSDVTVPVTNTTNSASFVTGILYDGNDGTPYDGTQDLVFVTIINGSQVGSYGTYDYEVRVPSGLGTLVGVVNSVEKIDEIH